MAKEKTKAKPQTSAETEKTYASAMDKIRDEMANSKSEQIQLLGEGLTAMLQLHPELEDKILEKGKTLNGALGAVRAHATGGCSDPVRTTKSLCEYFGIKCENPHVLAMEVAVAMMGGEAAAAGTSSDSADGGATFPKGEGTGKPPMEADPFDLDSILGVL